MALKHKVVVVSSCCRCNAALVEDVSVLSCLESILMLQILHSWGPCQVC